MELKKQICQAFCNDVNISTFEDGIAISTPYQNYMGDKIGLYLFKKDDNSYRLVDNALTVSFLEGEGVNLDSQHRMNTFNSLLEIYKVSYDEEFGELYKDVALEYDVARSVLDFSALLLRMNDLLFLTKERVENTFKDDVKTALIQELSNKVTILEDQPISQELSEIIPDMVFFPENREPVALFLASNETKLWQAIHLQMIANYEAKADISVVAMLENDKIGNQKIRNQADNRLDAVPRYAGGQKDAIHRVVTEVLGRNYTMH